MTMPAKKVTAKRVILNNPPLAAKKALAKKASPAKAAAPPVKPDPTEPDKPVNKDGSGKKAGSANKDQAPSVLDRILTFFWQLMLLLVGISLLALGGWLIYKQVGADTVTTVVNTTSPVADKPNTTTTVSAVPEKELITTVLSLGAITVALAAFWARISKVSLPGGTTLELTPIGAKVVAKATDDVAPDLSPKDKKQVEALTGRLVATSPAAGEAQRKIATAFRASTRASAEADLHTIARRAAIDAVSMLKLE